jgi:hypothetical protein
VIEQEDGPKVDRRDCDEGNARAAAAADDDGISTSLPQMGHCQVSNLGSVTRGLHNHRHVRSTAPTGAVLPLARNRYSDPRLRDLEGDAA